MEGVSRKERVMNKLKNLQFLIPELASTNSDHRKLATSGIGVSIGLISLLKPSIIKSLLEEGEDKLFVDNSASVLKIVQRIRNQVISQKKSSYSSKQKIKLKYLYWTLKETANNHVHEIHKSSIARVKKAVEKGSLKSLPDPLIHCVWLQNDNKEDEEFFKKQELKSKKKMVDLDMLFNERMIKLGAETSPTSLLDSGKVSREESPHRSHVSIEFGNEDLQRAPTLSKFSEFQNKSFKISSSKVVRFSTPKMRRRSPITLKKLNEVGEQYIDKVDNLEKRSSSRFKIQHRLSIDHSRKRNLYGDLTFHASKVVNINDHRKDELRNIIQRNWRANNNFAQNDSSKPLSMKDTIFKINVARTKATMEIDGFKCVLASKYNPSTINK